MAFTPEKELELLNLHMKKITQIVRSYVYRKGAAPRRQDAVADIYEDYLQEAILAFMEHLRSPYIKSEKDVVPYYLQIISALYKMTVRLAPFTIPIHDFKEQFPLIINRVSSFDGRRDAEIKRGAGTSKLDAAEPVHVAKSIVTSEDRIQMERAGQFLTRRQRVILMAMLDGLTRDEIMEMLDISDRTMTRERRRIIEICRQNDAIPSAICDYRIKTNKERMMEAMSND